jgi:hypothetical protein
MKLEKIKPDDSKPLKMRFHLPFSGKDFTSGLRDHYKENPVDAVSYAIGLLRYHGWSGESNQMENELKAVGKGEKKIVGSSDSTLEIVPE